MEQGFNYSYYDELGKHIAIVQENTPKETIEYRVLDLGEVI